MKNDYHSNDIGTGSISYDNSATYLAAHVGIGKLVTWKNKDTLDYYGKLFYTHQNGSNATLNTGHVYEFGAINSVRSRLGFRYTHQLSTVSSIFGGLAWQHEFDGDATATIHANGLSATAPSPGVKGDTGVLELGVSLRPGQQDKFAIGLGLTGYTGKTEGIGANASLVWNF